MLPKAEKQKQQMKKTLLTLSLMAAGISILSAADAPAKESFFSGVSIAPVGVVAYPDVTGKRVYGAGVNLGYQLNKNVSLNATAIGFEDPDQWRGEVVDELDATAKFDLLSASKLTLYGVAGGSRQFHTDDWAVDVGAGARFNFSKHVFLFGQYTFQVWVHEGASAQVQAGLGYSF